jgi:translation initiation factor IF-1
LSPFQDAPHDAFEKTLIRHPIDRENAQKVLGDEIGEPPSALQFDRIKIFRHQAAVDGSAVRLGHNQHHGVAGSKTRARVKAYRLCDQVFVRVRIDYMPARMRIGQNSCTFGTHDSSLFDGMRGGDYWFQSSTTPQPAFANIPYVGKSFEWRTMSKEDSIEVTGTVVEKFPSGLFSVQLDQDRTVLAHLAGKLRRNRIRVLAGDRVTLELSPYDLTKGRITYRHK